MTRLEPPTSASLPDRPFASAIMYQSEASPQTLAAMPLAKFVIALQQSTAMTAATQWFERTLDDSANKRLSLPQAFLAVDAILIIWKNIMDGLVVYPKMIEKRIMSELPFMATEYIIMECVKQGGDRQELHERIRQHSMEAGKQVKVEGKENDLIDRILADDYFKLDKERLDR